MKATLQTLSGRRFLFIATPEHSLDYDQTEQTNIFFQYDSCEREVLAGNPYICHLFYSTKQQSALPALTSGSIIEDKNVDRQSDKTLISNFDARDDMISDDQLPLGTSLSPTATDNNASEKQDSQTLSPRSARFAAKASLHQLGILLLELCFGQIIESIPLRNNFLINGTAHDQTDFLTAYEWKSEVEDEAGEDFKFAVNNCFNFEVNPDWNDTRFTQSIYAGVVKHLEKALKDMVWKMLVKLGQSRAQQPTQLMV